MMLDNHVSHHPQAALSAVWVQIWQDGGLRGGRFQCTASTASTDTGIYGFARLATDILVNALSVDHAGSAYEVTLDFAGADQFVEDGSVNATVCDSRGDLQETGKDLHLSGGGCLKGGFFFVTEHSGMVRTPSSRGGLMLLTKYRNVRPHQFFEFPEISADRWKPPISFQRWCLKSGKTFT